jgi:hypothetical protein
MTWSAIIADPRPVPRPSALVRAEGLHRRVVDDLHRSLERAVESESDPTASEVRRLGGDLTAQDPGGNADRDDVILPIADEIFHLPHHQTRRHAGTGRQLAPQTLSAGLHFDVGPADIDDQDLHVFPGKENSPAQAFVLALRRRSSSG